MTIEQTQDDTYHATDSRDGGQCPVNERVTLKLAREPGTEASQSESHCEAKTVAQTASMRRRVLRDQAVVDRLMHEVDKR